MAADREQFSPVREEQESVSCRITDMENARTSDAENTSCLFNSLVTISRRGLCYPPHRTLEENTHNPNVLHNAPVRDRPG